MDIASLLISLISGAVGGNVAGAAMPDKNLGTLGNSVAGLLGGGASGWILQALGILATAATTAATGAGAPAAGNALDLGSILGNIAGSGVGGALLTTIVALIKNATQK